MDMGAYVLAQMRKLTQELEVPLQKDRGLDRERTREISLPSRRAHLAETRVSDGGRCLVCIIEGW